MREAAVQPAREDSRPATELRCQVAWTESFEKVRDFRAREIAPLGVVGAQEPEKRPLFFRPADFYSEETLRHVRICGECGFRLSPSGCCARCAVATYQRIRT
jgi:hypothetical protein